MIFALCILSIGICFILNYGQHDGTTPTYEGLIAFYSELLNVIFLEIRLGMSLDSFSRFFYVFSLLGAFSNAGMNPEPNLKFGDKPDPFTSI